MSDKRLLTSFFASLVLACVVVPACSAQTEKDEARFLVARRDIGDPLFRETVVLMLPIQDTNVMVGVIVNRRTRIALGELFPSDPALKSRTDLVYFGGPIDTETACALFRSPKSFKQAVRLVGDLYITFDSKFIKAILKKPQQVLDVRLFLGRAQWSPRQLQDEMSLGAWYSSREEDNWIFSPEPENVWRTLIAREEPGPRAQLHLSDHRLALRESSLAFAGAQR